MLTANELAMRKIHSTDQRCFCREKSKTFAAFQYRMLFSRASYPRATVRLSRRPSIISSVIPGELAITALYQTDKVVFSKWMQCHLFVYKMTEYVFISRSWKDKLIYQDLKNNIFYQFYQYSFTKHKCRGLIYEVKN